MSLAFKKLSIGYKGHKKAYAIAAPLDIEIPKAKLTAIIGKNGAGKTTLIKTIAQLVKPLEGQVYLEEIPLEQLTDNKRAKKISFVFTSVLSSENMTVQELVALGRYPYLNWYSKLSASDLLIIRESLEFTEIAGLANTKIHSLSDGQKQKALIARALVQDTDYMVLDEPMSHLDHHHKSQLLSLLKKLVKEKNKTIVYTTHDIEKAIVNADYILALSSEKVSFDTPNKLIEKGIFHSLFPKDLVTFDPATARFLYRDSTSK